MSTEKNRFAESAAKKPKGQRYKTILGATQFSGLTQLSEFGHRKFINLAVDRFGAKLTPEMAKIVNSENSTYTDILDVAEQIARQLGSEDTDYILRSVKSSPTQAGEFVLEMARDKPGAKPFNPVSGTGEPYKFGKYAYTQGDMAPDHKKKTNRFSEKARGK